MLKQMFVTHGVMGDQLHSRSRTEDYDQKVALIQCAKEGRYDDFLRIVSLNMSWLRVKDHQQTTLLHHAVQCGASNIVEFIITHSKDSLNELNNMNETSLHWAARLNNSDCMKILVENGINTKLLNRYGYSALHVAIEHNCCQSLETLIHLKVDVKQRTTRGLSALHVAAIHDHVEVFQILLNAGLSVVENRNQGRSPLDTAASSGSIKIMKFVLENCERWNLRSDDLLQHGGNDGSNTLHTAISNGSEEAIKLCLKHGAKLDSMQAQDCTALHLLSSQGSLENIKLVFEVCPQQALDTMNMTDRLNHTPLHRAAMFDHYETVEFLVEQGARLDVVNDEQQTPLLLAASRGCWKSLKAMVQTRSRVQNKGDVLAMLQQKDCFGYAPLHYATREGNIESFTALLQLGISPYEQTIQRQTPLHIASYYGRYKICKIMLNTQQGGHLINEKDLDGNTPLHFAAMNGHFKIVQLFLSRGANVLKTNDGRTPLHAATMNGYTKTVRILLEFYEHLMNLVDKNGDTALHIATSESQVHMVSLFLNLNAEFKVNLAGHTAFTSSVIKRKANVANVFIEMALDRCVTTDESNPKSKDYWEEYTFKYIRVPPEMTAMEVQNMDQEQKTKTQTTKNSKKGWNAYPVFDKMVEFQRVECLRHPLTQKYLDLKWKSFGMSTMIRTWSYVFIHAILITLFVDTVATDAPIQRDGTHYCSDNACSGSILMSTKQWVLLSLVLIISLRLISYLCFWIQRVVFTVGHVIWIVGVISLMVYLIPLFLGKTYHWQQAIGSTLVLATWFHVFFYVGFCHLSGSIYVQMFYEVVKTLFRALSVYWILIVSFIWIFYAFLRYESHNLFNDLVTSVFSTIVMLTGEIGWSNTFVAGLVDEIDPTLHYSTYFYVVMPIFMLTMPIVLMNLLIGLAVGDIAKVRNTALVRSIANESKSWSRNERNNSVDCNHDNIHNPLKTELLEQKQRLRDVKKTTDKLFESIKSIMELIGVEHEEGDDENIIRTIIDQSPTRKR